MVTIASVSMVISLSAGAWASPIARLLVARETRRSDEPSRKTWGISLAAQLQLEAERGAAGWGGGLRGAPVRGRGRAGGRGGVRRWSEHLGSSPANGDKEIGTSGRSERRFAKAG